MEICCVIQGAQIWCSVTTWWGGMGWELEVEFKRKGTYVCLWLIHFYVWQKPTQYCKAIFLQLNKFKLGILKWADGTSGGPTVKTLCSKCRGHRFNPWLGKIPSAPSRENDYNVNIIFECMAWTQYLLLEPFYQQEDWGPGVSDLL